ncbi:MAG: dihydrofolate reductase family protein [Hyphomonas sp.]
MAKLAFGLNMSLDGYVDHDRFAPDPVLFRHFIEQVRFETASIYGRRMYEIMAYWDEDQPGWQDAEREYAEVWRAQPKYVVSRTLTAVGPNATLISENVEAEIRRLKADLDGEISITGPNLASSLAPLIDEYQIYLHPVILGTGTPMFQGPRPPLRLTGTERIGENAVRLTYVPT